MSDYDSNYNNITCPFCQIEITNHKECDHSIGDLKDEEEDFFECPECKKFLKIKLWIYKSCDYIVIIPTKKEIKEHNLIVNKNVEENIDIPGQTLFWEN